MATTCSLKKRTIQDVGCGKDTDESCKRVNACLSMLRKTIPLGNDEEGRCFQLGLASEKHGEWRLAWELFFGLVEHLGTLRSTKASDMYAHAAVRCASLASRVQGLVSFCDIPVLCSHLRVCFIEALGEKKLCRRLPAPRKLLEWIVHVALPLNTESCSEAATAATECWQQVQQALLQGGDQAVRALMDQRSSEEQTQLLRLLGHHARNVQPGATDVVADIMQRLLQQLVQNDQFIEALQETFSKPNDAALWLKTIATALEGLTLHLSCSSQKTRSLLDWADDFLVQLGAAVTGLRLQPLHAVLARGRLRAMEAFRATNSMSRSEVFDVWKEPIFQQLQVLVKQEGRSVKYGEVPAQLQPMFQLAGLLRCQGHVEHVEHVEHWCHRAQSFESLRLQLPPGPISAILALCQLQLHYQIFTSNFQQFKVISSKAAKVAVFSAECSSFGRLVISLATDPEFRAVLGSSGVSLALQALRTQLEHYISGGNEMGRMRFLQVQACALQAQLDGDPEDCKRFMNLALDEWQGVVLERWSDLRTPCSLMKALESAGDQRCGVSLVSLRDVSDAAYIMETLDLHALCMGALALCLACTVQQNGREALSWLQGTDGNEQNTLPRSSREVLVILLYRLAAAAGRLDQDGFGRRSNQVDALEWWKFAEVRKATLGDAPVAPIVTQRMIALTSMPESCFLSQWRSGGCRLEAFNADQGLQDGLMFAEAFWSWSQWSAKWQDIQCGQCPGGSAVGCQTAALRSLKVLFHGPKVYSQGQSEPSQALSPELLRWPAWRSGLLQLRVIHQVSLLYDCLGESDLAIACADCGLELMERKLCGDCRWKIRFLCIRTRCAVSCFSDVTKEEHALHDIEDLWNRRIQGQPRVELTTTCEGVAVEPVEPVEPDGTISSPGMPWELLTLWVNASSKQRRQGRLLRLLSQAEAKLPSESVVLLIQLQMEDRSELWNETVQRLLKKISDHPSKAPFPRALCPALALLAQALFNDLKDGTCPGAEVNWSWSLLKAAADLKQCCMVLSQPAEQLIDSIQVAPSLKSFLQVCAAALRGALFTGESAVARHCAQLLLRVEEVVGAARPPRPPKLEEGTNSRERSPSRERGDFAFSRAQWKLCKQVVPCASGVSLLFMTELRAMQRRLEKMDHWSALERLGPGSTTSMLGVMAVEDICSGNWMSQLGSDMSLAWLQVDWKSSCLQISRSVDVNPERSERLLSRRLPLRSQVLRGLQDELQQLHRSNSEKIKELWQRQDKKSEAVRLEFWRSRKGFDDQLGKLVEKIQKEVLGVGRFLLAPWPQSAAAKQRVLDSLRSWLTNEAAEMADGLRLNGSLDDPEQAEHVFILALLLIEAENLEVAELLLLLGQLWDAGRSALRRWAYSMRRHSSDLRGSLKELNEASEVPLLLYVDGVMAQLPLEACPCLRQRNVVRGLAPSITLSSLASKPVAAEATGFFVIDPAEDCAAMGDVRQLLTSWSSHGQSWHGHTGKLPEPSRVLEELCRKDVFVYLGHGERARQLLRHEKLQIAGEVAEENDSRRAGLRSTLMLLGCSSVKIQKGSMEGDIESFGLASSALLGGAPLVLGAQWDVLGGDLDKLASRLLQRWLKEGKTSCPSRGGLLTALKDLRPKCLLPNLTGASLVCYGIPV